MSTSNYINGFCIFHYGFLAMVLDSKIVTVKIIL